ncbi:hypothetical protein [Dongshaea marina]|nr:hypothetical protein [Dongshaea marina]
MVTIELGKFIRDDKCITRRELLVTFLDRKVTRQSGETDNFGEAESSA